MNEDLFGIAPILKYKKPYIVSGKGCYLYDQDGNEYLDINCGQFSSVLGHSHEEMIKSITESVKTLVHLNTTLISENFIKVAKKLNELMPEMNSRILLLSTGGEANEACLRYAKNMNNNKPGIVSFTEGYHGLTHGTEGYSMSRKWVKPSLKYSFSINAPRTLEGYDIKKEYETSLSEFEKIVKENKDVIAAAIFEPIVSTGGLLYPEKCYWKEIRKICDDNQIYLIFDECQTGFGRTGNWFYYQQIECVPDMLVSAKAMGMGFPISMVAFNGNKFDDDMFKMHHFSSHQNEPFSADIILKGIEIIEKEKLLDNVKSMGDYLKLQLINFQKKYKVIESARGKGLMCGFDLKTYDLTKQEIMERSELLTNTIAVKNGLLLQAANYGATIRILPAYNITKSEIDELIEKLDKSFDDLRAYGYCV